MKTKTILVTGCAGFIGTHLCTTLVKQGHTVIGVDNLFTGSRENLVWLETQYRQFSFISHDITESMKFLDFIPIDEFYHLASIPSPEFYYKFPLKTIAVNVVGTKNVLDLALLHQRQGADTKVKVLYTSTSEVYGDPEKHPQSENYKGNVNCYGPRACYDESKRMGETLVYEYRKFNLDTKVVRIFNTYGPNMNLNDKRVIVEFVKNALQGKPLEIYGSGLQTRSFCYVDDMVDGLIKMMNSEEEGPINLGNDSTEFMIKIIAERIIEMTESSSEIIYKEKLQDDPSFRRPDLTLAKEKLNWYPTTSLEEGLRKTILYVKEKLLTK